MKRTIDDLPMVKASTVAAAGLIGPETRSAVVQFGDVGYAVGVKVHRFPKCGGWWALSAAAERAEMGSIFADNFPLARFVGRQVARPHGSSRGWRVRP
jgi:hypothetical protein